jgi:NAD(P)-dependent dehydrogenase (short-subunit alcohol dehydrogenase family)
MLDIKHKRVLIIGGSGLIGSALVEAFNAKTAYTTGIDMSFNRQVFVLGGPFDVVINAAYPKDMTEHINQAIEATSWAAENMAANDVQGSIINFASIYGIGGSRPEMYQGVPVKQPSIEYAMAKGGIINMTRWAACKYATYGIRVNCVSPGGVEDNQNPLFQSRYNQHVPMGRMATPEDIVGPVMFLASDMSKYGTGHNLVVDGGWSAW